MVPVAILDRVAGIQNAREQRFAAAIADAGEVRPDPTARLSPQVATGTLPLEHGLAAAGVAVQIEHDEMVRHDDIPAALAQLEPPLDAGPDLRIGVLGEPDARDGGNVVGLDSASQNRIGQCGSAVALPDQELRHDVANRGGISGPAGKQLLGDSRIRERRQSPGGGGAQGDVSVAMKDRRQVVSHLVECAALEAPHGEDAPFQSEISVERLDAGAIHVVSEVDMH